MEDLHIKWPHRWITKKAKPGESKIHGTGMFATEDIAKDEMVAVYGGIIVPKSEVEEFRIIVGGMRGIQIDKDFFICATEKAGGLFNHSCNNNLGYSGQITIVAIKDIKAGEELVHDYALSEASFKPYECTCKSPNCRKTITQDDWKSKELQNKWGNYFTPYLKSRFNE